MAKSKSSGNASTKTKVARPPPPKDEEEEELEKLVFGDLAGFKAGIRGTIQDSSDEEEAEKGTAPDTTEKYLERDLAEIPDDEVCTPPMLLASCFEF